jgi:anti-anti-sigma regulatory factor
VVAVTLKIETVVDGPGGAMLRLVGRIDSQNLEELEAEVSRRRPRLSLDLDEVTLVDVAVVRFLHGCEALGIELLNCPPYIREWMGSERERTR